MRGLVARVFNPRSVRHKAGNARIENPRYSPINTPMYCTGAEP